MLVFVQSSAFLFCDHLIVTNVLIILRLCLHVQTCMCLHSQVMC